MILIKEIHVRSSLIKRRLFFCLSNHRIKLLLALFCLLGVFLSSRRLAPLSSIMGWQYGGSPELELPDPRQRFTVLINTWRRWELLKKSVEHYSSCRGVDAIRVVWSEVEPPSDSLLTALMQSVRAGSHKLPYKIDFRVDLHDEGDLNNRFKPIKGLKTEAVFSIDDDVVVSCESLKFAFSVWSNSPASMVGFVPRMHWLDSKKHEPKLPHYLYGGWWSVWWTGRYSMMLTKAAFFHSKYLDAYTNQMPAIVRQHVAEERNCEDIAMSFLVANITGAPPMWVKGKIYEIGSTGVSSLKGHGSHRTHCLNDFVSIYGYMPLIVSNIKVVNLQNEWMW